ncbi:MAG TPA: DUF4337 family protein [Candidatus Angelobacter sp.]|jgi:hypothetical protein|nr:DUF4337 family protein [Candidatus Angelobacter sp.]
MNPEELKESTEHAHLKGEKAIGLTMAVVAVLLAVTTLLSHRSHTEEILLQGKASDKWNFYQAKHIRAYEFAIAAEETFLLPNGKEVALRDFKKSTEEECGMPIEKECKSPLLSKDSPILSQLAKEAFPDHNKDQKTEDNAAQPIESEGEAGHAAASGEKPDKPGKQGAPKEGARKIQEQAFEFEHERDQVQHRANFYDAAELFLEVSIVLCSISLLADDKLYWRLSFASTIAGIAVILAGALLK